MRTSIQILILCVFGLVCYQIYMLFDAERDFSKYLQTKDKQHLVNALNKDMRSTMYLSMSANEYPPRWAERYIQTALATYNGDITACGIYYAAALVAAETGNRQKAIDNLEISLYYNPNFKPAKKTLDRLVEQ